MRKNLIYFISKKRFGLILILLLYLVSLLFLAGCSDKDKLPANNGNDNNSGKNMKEIIWHDHSTIQLNSQEKNVVIYVDPYNLGNEKNNLDNNQLNNNLDKADIILITHAHYDHCSLADAIKVSKPTTIILSTADCMKNLEKLDVAKKIVSEPNKKYDINGIMIETIPAYNINTKFHPKENKWVGYIINLNNKKYYHGGDTDKIPEMASLQNIDIAFLPIGGTYTMNVDEAAEAVKLFNPKKVIPIHYGTIVGTKEDAELFKEKCDCNVEILEED